jgi:hypothetical protein
VTRDETAWTWWTLPPVTAGCFAQRYHRRSSVFLSALYQPERVAVARLWRPAGYLLMASGYQVRRGQSLRVNNSVAARGRDHPTLAPGGGRAPPPLLADLDCAVRGPRPLLRVCSGPSAHNQSTSPEQHAPRTNVPAHGTFGRWCRHTMVRLVPSACSVA